MMALYTVGEVEANLTIKVSVVTGIPMTLSCLK
jgi:hypothetical protein